MSDVRLILYSWKKKKNAEIKNQEKVPICQKSVTQYLIIKKV